MNKSGVCKSVWTVLLGAGMAIGSSAQTLTTLGNFDGTNGDTPRFGNLIQGTDGNFYGTTYYGGTNNGGTVFKVTPAGALTTLYSFSPTKAETLSTIWIPGPESGLVKASDGNLYGVTRQNGATN